MAGFMRQNQPTMQALSPGGFAGVGGAALGAGAGVDLARLPAYVQRSEGACRQP
jgi:hypothetical protein